LVHDHSFIHFEYKLLPLVINLADFPRPLVQNLFTTESILIVIPDQYSLADLEAAASVAAAVGQRAFGNLTLDVITAAQATPQRLAGSGAIIIGQPARNAFLLNLYQRRRLPTSLAFDHSFIIDAANHSIAPDDGVLQETPSDFSEDQVYLVVTGASEVAVTRAARTLSALTPGYGIEGNLVTVAEFQEKASEVVQPTDTLGLADLGFKDTILYGIDTQVASVRFFIPSNWRLVDDPTLILNYAHSSMLQMNASDLTVKLNNKVTGDAPLDTNVLGERQAVIRLPRADFRVGAYNHLNFEATMTMELPKCALPDVDLAWIRISNSSQLQLPHTVEQKGVSPSLEDPLRPFASLDLSDVWLALPDTPTPEELGGMIRVAFWLGSLSHGAGFAPHVSRGAISDTTQLNQYHLIAVGLPTNNPVIAALNEHLPQPFVPGEDSLRQQIGNVVYRLPDKFSIGLLQALPAPWNPVRAVLVATGTTQQGVEWAIKALTDDEVYYEMAGDLAFIRGDRIESVDSAKYVRGPLATAVQGVAAPGEEVDVEALPTATVPPTVTPAASALEPKAAAIPERYLPQKPSIPPAISRLVLGLVGAGLVIAVAGGILSWRRARTR
jgi:hypothetical protein